jgi:hypothetical protein
MDMGKAFSPAGLGQQAPSIKGQVAKPKGKDPTSFWVRSEARGAIKTLY